jgi:COP9 signalosome complex subunit 6
VVHCCLVSHTKAHYPPRTGLFSVSPVYLPHDAVQFSLYCSTPLLLILQPVQTNGSNVALGHLPLKAYEPMIEIRDGSSRSLYVEATFNVETGEAERIAVDTTARGGEGGTSRTLTSPSIGLFSTLLSSRISSPNATSCRQNATRSNPGPCELCQGCPLRNVLSPPHPPHIYLSPISGSTPKDHATIRSLVALVASLPASDSQGFRDEFETVPILSSKPCLS